MTETRWLDDGEARAWRGYVRMAELLGARLERELQCETGLSIADHEVLVHLSEAEGRRLRMSELAALMLWSKSRLSHHLGRMESRRLVRRQGCPTDARGVFAVLTAPGLRVIEAASPHHVASVRRHLVDRLSPGQLEALAEISETIVDHLSDRQSHGREGRTGPRSAPLNRTTAP